MKFYKQKNYKKLFINFFVCILIIQLSQSLFSCKTVQKIDIPFFEKKASTEEERIIALLDSVEKMVERKQMKKVMDYVSMEYRDDQNRKYNDIRDYLQSIARDYRVIRITRNDSEVKIEGNKASVLDTFGTVAEPYDPVNEVPVNLQGRVIITLQKETDGWKIVSW
jgi:ketosteroid isomerase-like protein